MEADAGRDIQPDCEALEVIYRERVAAELKLADGEVPGSDTVRSVGDPFARVMLVKGEPGPAEVGGGVAFDGPDGEAARKALEALGHDPASVFYALSRPITATDLDAAARRVRRTIEAVDPAWVVCVDETSCEDVARALHVDAPPAGREAGAVGRRVLCLSGLEASLADDSLKRRVWAELKAMESTQG